MKAIKASSRARGSNRGGCGGGFEITDPDYCEKKLAKLKADYLACPPEWRETFTKGLSRFEVGQVTGTQNA
jgi:hypothetical protein